MPRKPIKSRKKPRPVLHDSLRHYLETGNYCTRDRFPDCPAKAETFLLAASSREKQLAIWQLNQEVILNDWIKRKPCTRPWAFWELDVTEIRRRIGGTGDLFNDLEDYGPHECYYGIPSAWVTAWDVESYNGRALDIYGKVIPSPWKDGDFTRVAVDPNDPPVFESEAVYLQRLGFLTPVERGFLEKNPELLEPEQLEIDE